MVIKRRSPNYPGISLEEAIRVIVDLYQGHTAGAGVGRGQFTPQDAATAWGYSSTTGPVQIRIGALRQYGLLEGKKGENPKLSNRAMTLILRDQGSREHRDALRESAVDPTIFAELHESLPGAAPDALRQFLIVDRNFTSEGATRLIRVYSASIIYAGLDEYDIIATQDESILPDEEENGMPPIAPMPEPPVARATPAGSMTIPVNFAEEKVGTVTLPVHMTQADWRRLDRILAAYRPDETAVDPMTTLVEEIGLDGEPEESGS